VGETIDDIVTKELTMHQEDNQITFKSNITPQMTNALGTLSNGVFISFISEVCSRLMTQMKKGDLVVEHISVYFIKPVQIENTIQLIPKILEIGRKSVKVDVEIYNEKDVVGKAMLLGQLIDRY